MAKVAIIIPNYNGQKYLADCLSSLSQLDYPDYQLFFVDNNSTDGSVEYVKNNFPEIELIISDKNTGFAQGNNLGWQKIKEQDFDYFMTINQDTVSQPDFLNKLVKVAESDEKIAALQPRLMLYPEKDKINS